MLKHSNTFRRRGAALLWVLLQFIYPTVNATTILGMDIAALSQEAELVFEGQVLQHNTQENSAGMVVTYVTFEVRDVVKGSFSEQFLELKFTGGTLNGRVMEVSGMRMPLLDEEGIYFVESMSRDLINPLIGWSQGHYLINDETGERRISTIDRRPVTRLMPTGTISSAIKRPPAIIDGDSDPATGVITEVSPLLINRAMTVDNFKAEIRKFVEN
tara:strand:- start:1289 stop:1933 length:645 start_codon:yes stop_codon:yes gene_type:complete